MVINDINILFYQKILEVCAWIYPSWMSEDWNVKYATNITEIIPLAASLVWATSDFIQVFLNNVFDIAICKRYFHNMIVMTNASVKITWKYKGFHSILFHLADLLYDIICPDLNPKSGLLQGSPTEMNGRWPKIHFRACI